MAGAGFMRRWGRRIIASQSERSVVKASTVVEQVKEIWDIAQAARDDAERLQGWHDLVLDKRDLPAIPDDAPPDFKKIRETSPSPWGRLIVNTTSQMLAVDDFRLRGTRDSSPAFEVWGRNGLDAKQIPLHNGALTHGLAYNLILPAVGRRDGEVTAMIRGKSALRTTAFYRDDFDEYPEFALEVPHRENDALLWQGDQLITFYDDEAVHYLSIRDKSVDSITYIEGRSHGMGICPLVRFACTDLEGHSAGEIDPFITLFKRIDQDTNDRLVVQRYGAFVVRTIAGLDKPDTDALQRAARIALGFGDLLVAPDEKTKFGHIPGTPLDGYIAAREADIRDLGGLSQTPSYRLLGLSDNVGAEGIKAADASLDRKIDQIKRSFGQAHEMSMRLAGVAMNDESIADDYTSSAHWAVIDPGSLQSLSQALGGFAEQLEIPPELLWDRIPDWTRDDTERAIALRQQREDEALAREMMLQGGDDGDASTDARAGEPDSAAEAG